MITSLRDYFETLIKNEISNSNQIWKPSDKFFELRTLSIDQRGRIGEVFVKNVFKELNMDVNGDENGHGDWDVEVNNIKIEVKLATLDVNKKFQHEGIKSSKLWDLVAFVDVAPNELYVTFVANNNFTFNEKNGTVHFNQKTQNIHFRGKDGSEQRATGAGYKVDFKAVDLVETKTIKDFENSFLEAIKILNLSKS